MKNYKAVEDRWPFEPRTDYPEFNTAIAEIDEAGNRVIVAKASTGDMARRIAAAMHNCDYGAGEWPLLEERE